MSARERIERRLTKLRHDDRFEAMLTDTTSRSPEIIKLVLAGQIDAEHLREFALRVIATAFTREEDAKHEPLESRYDQHVDAVMDKLYGEDESSLVESEEREAYRAFFRYVAAVLRATTTKEEAYRSFGVLAPELVDLLVTLTHDVRRLT